MTRETFVRIGLAIAIVIGGIVTKSKFPKVWDGIGAWSQLATPGIVRGVGITAAILLAIGIGILIWDRFVLLRRRHSYDAQLGRGITTAMIVFLLAVSLLLAIGAYVGSRLIVMGIGVGTIGLSAWLAGGLIVEGVKAIRKKRGMRA